MIQKNRKFAAPHSLFPALAAFLLFTGSGYSAHALRDSGQHTAHSTATSEKPGTESAREENEPAPQPHLLPQPREVALKHSLSLAHGISVHAADTSAEDRFAARDLAQAFEDRGVPTRAAGLSVELLRASTVRAKALLEKNHIAFDDAMKPEGYVIVPALRGLSVIGSTPEGVFYGAQTVKQLIEGSGAQARLDTGVIRDWPAMPHRGLDDDLSRGPVPTLDFQKKQIRTIATYKLNIYSPYFEASLAYTSNPLPGLPGGSMTPADVAALVEYAKLYHVTIIPEQEAFGHLHSVLTFEKYAPLGETLHGHVLAPGQAGSTQVIGQWFTEIAHEFPSPWVHIGADETFELGRGQTKAEVDQRGLGAVYLDFLNQVYNTLKPLHKQLLFWGDVAMNEPELVKTLPKDMIAVPWHYEPEEKGFDSYILPFKQAGMETWVAPGVNNWNRVYPDNNLALGNIQQFVRDGQRLGSTGMINTVWNDDGEGLFNEDWYGVLFGAAASWQPGESSIPDYQHKFGAVFHGDTSGKIDQAQIELMAAHAVLEKVDLEDARDDMFWIDPWSPQGQVLAAKIRPALHDLRTHAENALSLIAEVQASNSKLRETDALRAMELGARRIDFIGLKFELSDEIVSGYNRAWSEQKDAATDHKKAQDLTRSLYDITGTNGRCSDLRDSYSYLRDLFEQVWLSENRTYWLRNDLARYDVAIETWVRRGDAFHAAIGQWHANKTLPAPEELGLPRN